MAEAFDLVFRAARVVTAAGETAACVAVRDGSPVVPRLLEPVPHEPTAPLDVRGYGLRMLTNVAHSWGAEITAEGKVVWATLLTTGPLTERHSRLARERLWQSAAD